MTFEWANETHSINVDFDIMYYNAHLQDTPDTIQEAVREYLMGLEDYDYYALTNKVVKNITHEFRIWLHKHNFTLPEEED